MSWKNLKITKKMSIGFGIILVLLSLVGGWAVLGMGNIINAFDHTMEHNHLQTDILHKEIDHLNWAGKVSSFLLDPAVTNLDVQMDSHQCAFGKWYYGQGRKEAEALIPELKPLLTNIEKYHNDLHQSAAKVEKTYNPSDPSEAIGVFNMETIPNLQQVQTIMGNIVNVAEKEVQAEIQAAEASAAMNRNSVIGIVLGTIVIGIALAWIITRGIVNPLKKSVVMAQHVADGDFTQKLEMDQKDEVGELVSALNHMAENLSRVMADIQESTEQVAASSEELSSSSQSLSSAATEQAASLEETSASIEQLVASVEQNASNSDNANDIAKKAATDAEQGGQAVQSTVESMKKIAEQIRIVDDIADQT
ncbi:HAMP domain-containing protein, partial [bacterium]|nr:HAMP domain-containing protein [bacterium]